MVNIIIDGKKLQVRDDVTILQAARENGFSIPTLCYLEGLNEIGACRLCLVEVKGQHRLVSSCNTHQSAGRHGNLYPFCQGPDGAPFKRRTDFIPA